MITQTQIINALEELLNIKDELMDLNNDFTDMNYYREIEEKCQKSKEHLEKLIDELFTEGMPYFHELQDINKDT